MGHAAKIALEYDALFCLINNEDVTWFCMYTVTNNGEVECELFARVLYYDE